MADVTVSVNGQSHTFSGAQTVASIVSRILGTPAESVTGVAVALDDHVIARSTWETTAVLTGARIELVTATQGG